MKELQIISKYSWIDNVDRQDQGNILYWEINIDLGWKVAFHPNCPLKQLVQTKYIFSFDVNIYEDLMDSWPLDEASQVEGYCLIHFYKRT